MAVEKMQMMNLVAPLGDMHDILQEVVLLEKVHIKNAMKEISDSNFTLSVLEEHLDSITDMGSIVRYKGNKQDLKQYSDMIKRTAQSLGVQVEITEKMDQNRSLASYVEELKLIDAEVSPVRQQFIETQEKIDRYEDFLKSMEHLLGLNIDVSDLAHMKHFNYHIGTLTKDKRLKLRNNYENISAIVLHIGSSVDGEVYLIFSPTQLEMEAERILKSLNFKEIELPKEFKGTPDEIYKKIIGIIRDTREEKFHIQDELESLRESYEPFLDSIYSKIILEEKIESLMENTAVSKNFFYFSGWLPKTDTQQVKELIESICPRAITLFSEVEEVPKKIIPPTKLKNSWLMKPFEKLVNIYGVPNYKEMDPTIFLGITYLVLFGAMFGDVGQGGILLLAGIILRMRSSSKTYGEIMVRIGISSVIFGFMYGSLFGFEDILPALVMRPMENINFILYSAIVFGVVLLLISFGISITNLMRIKDYEQGVFGRNGIVGLTFYIILLVMLLQLVLQDKKIPYTVLIIAGVILMAMMLFKKPLTAALFKEELHYAEGKKEYYIEGSFDLVETLLSLLSNTISFIRVGAFALNHVGLFLAFSTMAQLADNKAIGAVILIAGNIIIIGLECLIVFIQGLRLEYYELFSKYYTGDGIEYSPLKLK